MKKRGVAILILAVILTAFMCGCQARDDEGNTPTSVLKSGIEAFKNFDDEGLKKYFIDEGLENGSTSVFGDLPDEDGSMMEFMEASFSKLECKVKNTKASGDSATCNVDITTISNRIAYEKFLIKARAYEGEVDAEVKHQLWLEVFKDPDVSTVTNNIDVEFKMIDGVWKAIATEDFAEALAGGSFNTTGEVE